MTSTAGQAIGMQFQISTRMMFRARLTTVIALGRRTGWPGWLCTRSRTPRHSRSRPALLAERIAEPFPLFGIDLRPQRVAAIHDRRPVLVRRDKEILAEHPSLRVVLRGGELGDLGEVTLTWRVVAGPGRRCPLESRKHIG